MAVSEACQPSFWSFEETDALAAVDDQEGDAVVAALRGRLDGGHDEVGAHAVGDVGLLAVDHPAAVGGLGAGARRGDVGARAGLGDAERADLLAADRRHEIALLLILEPNFQIGGVAMLTCAPSPAAVPAEPIRAISSHRTASCR